MKSASIVLNLELRLLGFPTLPDLPELLEHLGFALPVRPLYQIRRNSIPTETAKMELTTIVLGALAHSMSALASIN